MMSHCVYFVLNAKSQGQIRNKLNEWHDAQKYLRSVCIFLFPQMQFCKRVQVMLDDW